MLSESSSASLSHLSNTFSKYTIDAFLLKQSLEIVSKQFLDE
jgi:hypothetical protein